MGSISSRDNAKGPRGAPRQPPPIAPNQNNMPMPNQNFTQQPMANQNFIQPPMPNSSNMPPNQAQFPMPQMPGQNMGPQFPAPVAPAPPPSLPARVSPFPNDPFYRNPHNLITPFEIREGNMNPFHPSLIERDLYFAPPPTNMGKAL
jgi:hypothetical protein